MLLLESFYCKRNSNDSSGCGEKYRFLQRVSSLGAWLFFGSVGAGVNEMVPGLWEVGISQRGGGGKKAPFAPIQDGREHF